MELTVQDAARILGKSERQVRYLIQTGRLPATKREGQWKISRSDLPRSPGQERAEQSKTGRADEVAAAVLDLGHGSEGSKNKSWTVDRLHAVRHGEPLYRDCVEQLGTEHEATRRLRAALMLIGCGFFEYDAARKAARYSAARDCVSRAVIALLLDTEPRQDLLGRMQKDLLPPIGGLIRSAQRPRRRR
jgi:excisionase family DNA binding protein